MNNIREGHCFELAWRQVVHKEQGTLIHVKMWSALEDKVIDHALVELTDNLVYEPVTDKTYDKNWFYQTLSVKETARYSVEEAAKLAVRTGHLGPWVKR